MIYLKLFLSMLQIGLFSIGGGYAAIPLIQEQIVTINHMLTPTEFTDIITIAEMTPGPIAINASTFVGTRIAGIGGAIVGTLGCILPSCIIVLILAKLYYKYRNLDAIQSILSGLRPAVVAMIASAGITFILLAFFLNGVLPTQLDDVNFISVGMFAIGMFILRKWKVNPMWIISGSGLVGVIVYSIM